MIKIVCAWCGKVVREGAPGVKLVSHLICPDCFEKEMQRLKEQTDEEKPSDGRGPRSEPSPD
jgi:hypothetical protein